MLGAKIRVLDWQNLYGSCWATGEQGAGQHEAKPFQGVFAVLQISANLIQLGYLLRAWAAASGMERRVPRRSSALSHQVVQLGLRPQSRKDVDLERGVTRFGHPQVVQNRMTLLLPLGGAVNGRQSHVQQEALEPAFQYVPRLLSQPTRWPFAKNVEGLGIRGLGVLDREQKQRELAVHPRRGYGHAPHLGQHVIGGIEVREPGLSQIEALAVLLVAVHDPSLNRCLLVSRWSVSRARGRLANGILRPPF
jgi:hypothetical protein